MPKTTKEIATDLLVSPDPNEVDSGATGAWQWENDEFDSALPDVEIITHRPRHTLVSRVGRVAHWLSASREYRKEVRERSLDIIHDVGDAGMTAKQVLPPRSVDFSDVSERRSVTAQFALDIRRRILIVRRVQQMIGLFSLLSVSQLGRLRPLPVTEDTDSRPRTIVPPVDTVEQVASHIDGTAPNDGDYIPLIIVKE